MKPLLPEKESRNGTGAKMLAQAKYCAAAIPLGAGFRYPSDFDRYRQARASGFSLHFRHHKPWSSVAASRSRPAGARRNLPSGVFWIRIRRLAPGI